MCTKLKKMYNNFEHRNEKHPRKEHLTGKVFMQNLAANHFLINYIVVSKMRFRKVINAVQSKEQPHARAHSFFNKISYRSVKNSKSN